MVDQIDKRELSLILSAVYYRALFYYDSFNAMNEINFYWPNGIKPSKEDIDGTYEAYTEHMELFNKLKKVYKELQ